MKLDRRATVRADLIQLQVNGYESMLKKSATLKSSNSGINTPKTPKVS